MKKYCLTITALLIATLAMAQKTFVAKELGIVGDGKTLNTQAIQKAVDKLTAMKKGGAIVFDEGRYLTGTIEMKSNVHFVLKRGAVLLGSTNIHDYRSIEPKDAPKSSRDSDNSKLALLVCYKAQNISITGEGEIDGQGRALALNVDSVLYMTNDDYRRAGGGRPLEIYRPKIINFMFLDGFEMRDITIRNPACWTQTYEICSNLKFENITVRSRAYWNNDGFDFTDCRNATINNCDVDSGDDGICLKSYYKGYCCENIRVTNCHVTSSCNALKLGTASFGGFRNIVFDNVKVRDTYLSAIAIESVDGCDIDDITFRNITATNTMNPLFIKLGNRTNGPAGHVRNILIENLTATVPFLRPDPWAEMRIVSNEGYHNPHPAPITGMPEQSIEGVTLRNIDITFPGHASTGMKYVPLWRVESVREDHRSYPEFTMYGELPAWGFYVRHVDGIRLENVRLRLTEDDMRPAIVFDDVKNGELVNVATPESDHDQIFAHKSFIKYDR